MNAINRLIVSLGALVLISAGVYILLLISGTLGPGQINGEYFVPQIERIAADTRRRSVGRRWYSDRIYGGRCRRPVPPTGIAWTRSRGQDSPAQ